MIKKGLEDNLSEDEDPSGARGIARANEILRRKGFPSVNYKAGSKKPIKEIIKLTPKEIGAAPNADVLVNKYLDEMRSGGYDIKNNYKKMDKTERWNYFLNVLRENDYYTNQ